MLPLNRNLVLSLSGGFYRSRGVICWPIVFLSLMVVGCGVEHGPSVEITRIPGADVGGGPTVETITGRVTGAGSQDRIVLFARSGDWYVQPFVDQPFTKFRETQRGVSVKDISLVGIGMLGPFFCFWNLL
jgi:hypothetical protein